jgi:hypothetical protein
MKLEEIPLSSENLDELIELEDKQALWLKTKEQE